ncbi:hypothetical protein CLNEO_22110 [Anaerotignum neopropionicum]|uniref:Uncharacterized protein n=1 Tax=Anaerotignum neopropionicum TaxID=36847 RepID=A0A136WCR0_9FIRM|nr:hypothetical protein [Anaerotignum neopropionicum]KXL52280.1 hypothetical protein CLNEO_22110 [Anaerotignum neopropionicum]
MNRKKELIIFVILIPLLLLSFMRLGGYYFSAEDVFYACEKGLHYGPSEKILAEYEFEDSGKLIVGKWKENLSAISVDRAFGVLWKLKSGGITGFISCEKVVTANIFRGGKVMGLASQKEIREVYCRIEYGDYGNDENPSIQEMTMTVDQDGFFYGIWSTQIQDDTFQYIAYIEGRNAYGEVIYRDGMSPEGKPYLDGVLIENTEN